MAIGGSDGSIILTTQVDPSGINKGMTSMKSGVKSLAGNFAKLGAAIGVAFSVKALISFSSESSKLATNTEASVQRLIDIYGSASRAVGDFIDANAHAIGMSRSAAASFSAVYGNLFSVWADQRTNAQLTNEYLNATAVVASKTGRTMEDVQERIRSGLLGNTEAVEDLGIFVNVKTIEMTEAFQSVAKGAKWESLTAAQQAQIRALAILEQATNKYGNEVAQTNALTRAQYNAAFEDFKNTWGTVVNYILMPILRVLTKVFQYATAALQAIFKISGKTINVDTSSFNEQEQAIGGAVDNQNDLTEAVNGTAKAQKKLLAGFDDLQILSKSTSSSGDSSGASLGSSITLPEFSETQGSSPVDIAPFEKLKNIFSEIQDIASSLSRIFESGFWQGFQNADFADIKLSLKNIGDSLIGIFSSPEVKKSIDNYIKTAVKSLGKFAGSVVSIGRTIASNLLGGFSKYLTSNAPFIKESIVRIFDASSDIATAVGNMWVAFADIFSAFASENGQTLTANIIGIFTNAGLGITALATRIGADFIHMLSRAITDNRAESKKALDDLLKIFSDFTDSIKKLVDELVGGVSDWYEQHISPLWETLTKTLSDWVGTLVSGYDKHIKPVLKDFAEQFRVVVEQYISPMVDKVLGFAGRIADSVNFLWKTLLAPMGEWIIGSFSNLFGEAFGRIGDIIISTIKLASGIISGLMDVLNGIIDFITGVFTGDWEKAWEGIVGIFKGIANSIITTFEGMINFIINGVNLFISSLDLAVSAAGGIIGQDWNIPKISTVSIPRLARGAVIPPNREFLAVLGDQKHGTNIEAPAELIKQMVIEALELRGGVAQDSASTTVVLEVDGREFGRAVVEQGNKENRRIGTRLVIT